MLREIAIKNFAIIDDLRIRFDHGMTVLSGETGAGKSIIIQALNLLLGSRADASMIRTGAESAELEALFDMDTRGPAAAALAEQGHEPGEELVIRRILSRNDRHRVYINGRLATMSLLARVTENLAGISGQHEHQRLLRESEHLRILDQLAGLDDLQQSLADCYHEITPMIRKLEELRAKRKQQAERMELISFQQQEIEAADLAPGEEDQLREQLARLKNAENLFQTAGQGVEELYDRDGAVSERLKTLQKELEKAAAIDSRLTEPAEAVADAALRLEDTAEFLRQYTDGIEFDPGRMEEIEARIDTINKLKRKYGDSVEEILETLAALEDQQSEIEGIEEQISKTESRLAELHQRLAELTRRLSEKRKTAAEKLGRQMDAQLRALKMADTRFRVHFQPAPAQAETPQWLCVDGCAVSEKGAEQARFMISPNVGEDLKPLSRIASGGELSRIILALKALLADTEPVETIVFDEVDAGIGGEVAEVVGRKLADLADRNQVICITHLAQIARFGDHHYRITKTVADGRTTTCIQPLDPSDRIEETARMISGKAITDTTRAHAAEMLKSGRRASESSG